MAGIASGQRLTLRYDGHAFVPREPVEFKEGDEVTVTVVTVPDEISPEERALRQERWERIKSTFGTISAPEGFDWNFDRADLYRDIG